MFSPVGSLLLLLLPGVVGFLFLGNELDDNVLLTINRVCGQSWMSLAALVLITSYMLLIMMFVFNPTCLELEKAFDVPSRK